MQVLWALLVLGYILLAVSSTILVIREHRNGRAVGWLIVQVVAVFMASAIVWNHF